MKKEYDFTSAKKNPYMNCPLQQVENNVHGDSSMSTESIKKNDGNPAHSEPPRGAKNPSKRAE